MLTAIAIALWCLVAVEVGRVLAKWRLRRLSSKWHSSAAAFFAARALRDADALTGGVGYMSQSEREARIAEAAKPLRRR